MLSSSPAAGAVLDRPQLAGRRVKGRALDVAVAEGPDLRPHASLADERVVVRDRSVGVDAHNLAEQAVHALGLHAALGSGSLAERDEERPVAAKHQPAAEVRSRIE